MQMFLDNETMKLSENFTLYEEIREDKLNFEDGFNLTLMQEEKGIRWVPLDTFIGLVLAFSSCFFIGISVIFKKLALKDIELQGGTRAVDGGYGYLRLPKWWLGISLMALGECTNFVAYIFAPAILVTPLGVFSIVCTAALSPYFLKEHLRAIGKLGCVLVLVGCIIVTLCGPKDREVATMKELESQLLHLGFLIYASLVVGISLILMTLVPRYGHQYVLFYITICASFGSLSVMFCKGVGLAIKQTIMGNNAFTQWATWVCVGCLIGCLLIETAYMQRALDLFNSSLFMSVNYVMFTSMVIIASSILYTELRELGWKNIVLTILGFVVNIVALYLLHIDKAQETDPPQLETHCPDNNSEQGPQTPLMIKSNNNNYSPEKEKENVSSRNSPLSNIGLSPSLFVKGTKNGNFLSFLSRENTPENQVTTPMSESSTRSSISCNNACSYSSRSNLSDNSSLCSGEEDTIKTKDDNSRGIVTRHSLCEVPLITELQSSSWLSEKKLPSFSSALPKDGETPGQSTFVAKPPRLSSEVFSDADEGTQLV